jgi:hypothetical protein
LQLPPRGEEGSLRIMSTAEILAELPHLPPEAVEAIYHRAEELLQDHPMIVSPELLAAIDEADASPEAEDVPAEEVRKMISVWAHSK